MTLAPPIPSLEYLHIHDIDPLCYADDISSLLLSSKNLRHLKLHWSPRMRREREPSIHPMAYFGKMEQVNYYIPLKTMAICNMFISNNEICRPVCDLSVIEEVTMLNSIVGVGDNGSTAFMESEPWRMHPSCVMPNIKSIRMDKVSPAQCESLADKRGLEKLYWVGPLSRGNTIQCNGPLIGGGTSITPYSLSPPSSHSSPGKVDCTSISALKDSYLDAVSKNGATLKHLLLLPQWRLTNDDIAALVRLCPHLEELGFSVEFASFNHLRLLLPFLSKLKALRILANPDDASLTEKMRELDSEGCHEAKIAEHARNKEWSNVRYMELAGDDRIFELGDLYIDGFDEEGKEIVRRSVRRVPRSAVEHIAIWQKDSYEL